MSSLEIKYRKILPYLYDNGYSNILNESLELIDDLIELVKSSKINHIYHKIGLIYIALNLKKNNSNYFKKNTYDKLIEKFFNYLKSDYEKFNKNFDMNLDQLTVDIQFYNSFLMKEKGI